MKEVKSYLELHCQRIEDFGNDRLWMEQHIDFGFSELSLRDFYSQKFTPELITKYFEFHLDSYQDNVFHSNDNKHFMIFYSDYYVIDRMDRFCYDFPRTLDDFINDCQRADIKLYWKEVNNG